MEEKRAGKSNMPAKKTQMGKKEANLADLFPFFVVPLLTSLNYPSFQPVFSSFPPLPSELQAANCSLVFLQLRVFFRATQLSPLCLLGEAAAIRASERQILCVVLSVPSTVSVFATKRRCGRQGIAWR